MAAAIENDICVACTGKGYNLVPMPKGVTTEVCGECGGTGLRKSDRWVALMIIAIAVVFSYLIWRLA